jgi:alkaline phosphatase D
MPGGPTLTEILARPATRRALLAGTGVAALVIAARETDLAAIGRSLTHLPSDPFTLGVASGDPTPGGVVLWTRLAPDPLHGGLGNAGPVAVDWVVARDDRLRDIVQRGTSIARAQHAHSVHVELQGLDPGRPHWYRFSTDGYRSRIGRTIAGPAADRPLSRLRLGVTSCANWQHGQFAAYRHLAEEDLDLILHLGDYFYEYGPYASTLPGRFHTTPEAGPNASQLTTLADYRNRHAQYKTDPWLQAAHARTPWVVAFDDHDVENNYAGDLDEDAGTDPAAFLRQRAAAYRAYWEHMPLRRAAIPAGPDMRLYRRLQFGDLLDLHVLDTRQYRTRQPVDLATPAGRANAPRVYRPAPPPGGNPTGTLLGATQERWLLEGLRNSAARWNALGNQVMMASFDFGRFLPASLGGPHGWNMDSWDGYGAERSRLLAAVGDLPGVDLVVLTGDVHAAWAHDLEADFDRPGRVVATEFVGTSVTSEFAAARWAATERAAQETPWTQFVDVRHRGYATCTVTGDAWRTDFHAVDSSPDQGQVQSADAAVRTTAAFVVERGRPGAQPA